jgi:hypothetical protein
VKVKVRKKTEKRRVTVLRTTRVLTVRENVKST